ncbi:Lrp/AsnC family transcriptional regulator [Reinekea sp.]|jgi:Lrp/AsnC family leucine-responsive transcriptional regulator|uniref:Lrp/AsnC family transcriptional regulator n=1 Tax=Reinekea sp. TaxID=1970455 RepID=UPI0039897EF4
MAYQPDRIDLKILEELQANSRLTIVELAKRVSLTKTPCSERVKQLEKAGIIRGYHAELDLVAMGSDHITFVQVLLTSTTDADLAEFNSRIQKIPEVFGCHMVAGNFDYLLKVHTKDIYHFRSVLGNKISNLPGVQQTHSFVVMESVKDGLDVPVVGP